MISSSPVLGEDGTIYFECYDGKLYALNPDGTLKWAFLAGSGIRGTPCVGSDGTTYFGCYDGTIRAVNPDRTEKWSYPTGDIVWSYPVVKDYVLYIGSNDGNLHAIYRSSSDVVDSS